MELKKRERLPGARVVFCAALMACTGDPDTGSQQEALTEADLPGGTNISVDVASPADGAILPAGPVSAAGTAEIGVGVAVANTAILYVVDVSLSTDAPGGCGGDLNGDGLANTILDCEILAGLTLNDSAMSTGTVAEVGLVVFGSGAAIADVGPAPGLQDLTAPDTDDDFDGSADIEQVLASAQFGQVDAFTPLVVGGGATSYGSGVQEALAALAGSSQPNKIVVFVSDGLNNTGPSVAAALGPDPVDAVFHTFAIGSGASCTTGGALGTLQNLANATGGSCTNVVDVASLPDIIPSVIAAELLDIQLSLDGGPDFPPDSVVPGLALTGPGSAAWEVELAGLAPGLHELCATAAGQDGGGGGQVTECIVFQINSDPVAVCQDVTVAADATCSAPASIDGGSFDPDGDALTCTQDPPGPYALGTTAVELTCSDPFAATDSCAATVEVVDLTPPTVTVGPAPELWPPNHAHHPFSLADCVTAVTDNCGGTLDPDLAGRIVSIRSDEPERAPGTGNTCDDAIITGDATALLRAERAGNGDGRVYTIDFVLSDPAGNETPGSCEVHVPHDQSGTPAAGGSCAFCVGDDCGTCSTGSPGC